MDEFFALFKDPNKVGAFALLVAAVASFVKGWIVPGYVYQKVVSDCERMTQIAFRNVELAERSITVAEKTATPADTTRRP